MRRACAWPARRSQKINTARGQRRKRVAPKVAKLVFTQPSLEHGRRRLKSCANARGASTVTAAHCVLLWHPELRSYRLPQTPYVTRTKSAVRPILAAHLESNAFLADTPFNRLRRSSANSRERQQAAIALLDAADGMSFMPLGLVALQTAATLAACAATFALRPAASPAGPRAHHVAWGAGLAVTACAAQSMQLGLSVRRRADSIVAVSALAFSALAVGCAGTFILSGAHGAQASRDQGFAACLLGLSWLSHLAAMGAQLHRDETAWGSTPLPNCLTRAPGVYAALGGTSAALAIGGIASFTAPAASILPHPVAGGAALVGISIVAATIALSGAMREVDWQP